MRIGWERVLPYAVGGDFAKRIRQRKVRTRHETVLELKNLHTSRMSLAGHENLRGVQWISLRENRKPILSVLLGKVLVLHILIRLSSCLTRKFQATAQSLDTGRNSRCLMDLVVSLTT